MKISVVITNYNYEAYIGAALSSIQNQSQNGHIDQIIVIDDGSTDNSINKLTEYSDKQDMIVLEKSNAGQLSCFNAALEYIVGDIVFFLDADDVYHPSYIEKATTYYKNNPFCDFLFCDRNFIDQNNQNIEITKKKRIFPEKSYYGYTPVITYTNNLWIGAATSCLSMKTELLKKILPIPYESDWITRADDCLVWGASLALGYKCFLNEKLVSYRIHGDNYHHGKQIGKSKLHKRNLAINRLFKYLTHEYDTDKFEHLIAHEFGALPEKTLEDLKIYMKALSKSNMNNFIKLRQAMSIMKNYVRQSENA